MPYTRQNVWDLGGDWADPILWYARGVAGMKARGLAKKTSWRFYGAIHGFDQDLWTQLGYFSQNDQMPGDPDVQRFWEQCQHGTWYFLPWHRGYLLAFEANVRAIVTKLGGPADWALPYWNYFKPNEFRLPPAFNSPDWPDGKGDNPLFVEQRYGPRNDGKVYVTMKRVNLDAMDDPDFTGVASGGSPGFGGADTGFEHSGSLFGGLESQPHNIVHTQVGGGDPQSGLPGLMSDPDTAGLDPIFWLHHANIDRLWEVWRENPPSNLDPTDANWLKGPANVGDRIFSMPMPDGSAWDYTPGDMTDLGKLGYTYDDLAPYAPVQPGQRLLLLGAKPEAVNALQGARAVASGKNVELLGANQGSLKISGNEAQTSVQLDTGVRRKVTATLAAASVTAAPPDRVFLNLENVTGLSDATTFDVYVGLPPGANSADHPELLAGSVGLFGVRKASLADAKHAGKGLTIVLEITKIVDALHLGNAFDVGALDVRIIPVNPVPESAKINIGRISIFRQGQ